MLKRHEIQVLRRVGHSLEEVVKLAGVSQSSVQRVEAEPPVRTFDSIAERVRRDIGRPAKAEAFRALLVAELAKQPGVLGVELLRRARLAGYAGGKSATQRIVHYIESEGAAGMLALTESRKAWAAELGLTHEALYRALWRLQASGTLDMEGKRMSLRHRNCAVRR